MLNGENTLFIDSDKSFKSESKNGEIKEELYSFFDEVIELEPIILTKGYIKIRKFWVYFCANYQNNDSLYENKSIKTDFEK